MTGRRARLTSFIALPALCAGVLLTVARAEPNGETSAESTLGSLAFLAGSWSGDALGGTCEETWSTDAGGGMMGMFRLVHGEKAFVYEFMLIEQTDDGVRLSFRHISPGWKIWEQDIELPPVLDLAETGDDHALFLAPTDEHTPGAIEYRRDGDTLKITVTDRSRSQEGALRLELKRAG